MTEGNEIDAEMTGIQASHLETEPLGDEAMGDHDGQVQHEIDTLPVPAQGNPQKDPDSLFIPEDDPIPPSNVHQQPPPVDRIPSTNVPAPASTPAPAVLKSRSTISGAKMLERIRDREQKLKEKKLIAAQNGPGRLGPNNRTELFCRDEDKEKDRKATEEYHKKKRYYDQLRKKNGGNLGFADEIALIKIEKAEEERKRKRDRDNAKAQEGNSEDLSMHAGFNLRQNPEEELSNLDLAQPSTRKNVSIQDAELQSIRVAIEAANDIPRKKDKDKGPEVKGKAKASGRGKGKRANEAPKKVTKSSRRSKKKQMQLDNTAKQVSSLLCSDVFSQQAGVNAADEPFFKSKTKQQALKDIIASVPVESEKKAKGDMAVLLEASRQFGRGAVKPDAISSKQWSVRGMKTSLKAYQVLGAGFMRQRENASEEPRGGLLADQMGLGKTLMTLANIHDGRPPKNSNGPKTTLIVASPALLNQWKSEIERHSKASLSVMRYGAGTRLDSNASLEILRNHDIILASYTEVMKSHPKNEPPSECETDAEKLEWWVKTWERERGALHRVHFLRIVLDEAQAIKNHLSLTSIACRALRGDHKWALSGTPILNSLTELYPYFKFIGVPQTGNFNDFEKNYCSAGNSERLLVRLSQFMLRRTHADEMFGAPILKLPRANQTTYWCKFNSVERCIYDIVHARFLERINGMRKNGTLDKSYNNVLVMLLRLRQLTAHILMLQFIMRDLLEEEDIRKIEKVLQKQDANNGQSGNTIIAVRKQLEKLAEDEKKKCNGSRVNNNIAESGRETEEEDGTEVVEEEPESAGRSDTGGYFGKGYDFEPFLDTLRTCGSRGKAKGVAKCSVCNQQPREPLITSCGHFFCSEPCYGDACIESAEQGEENPACGLCGVIPEFVQSYYPDGFDPIDIPTSGTPSNKKKKSKVQKRVDHDDIADDWLASLDANVLPSAKTIAVKSQIMNWLKENPNMKIIVYTQFLAMVRIMSRICQDEGWKAEQYHGKMSLAARDNAIRSFAKEPDTKILLASLRCGGLGLNLTMASKVIMIDPWWNSATEQQAFCRVFRIGQKEKTFMSRLCVKGTVDVRLMKMQERKEREIKKVMEEGGKPVRGMDTERLIDLFKGIGEDSDGGPEDDL